MKMHGTEHTYQSTKPPSEPKQGNQSTDWPESGDNVSLKINKQSGKNRDRKSFSSGSQW